jgi:transcription elongation factor GreA
VNAVAKPLSGASVVVLGSCVLLEDLDDRTLEEYVLVPPPDSDPAAGRLSTESPVGRAIAGHRLGEVVDAIAPHTIRHLRIAAVRHVHHAA